MTATATKIATRTTADGATVSLWSDGCVTRGAFGWSLPGVGASRNSDAQALDVQAGFLALGEACVYDVAEFPKLVKTARRAVRQSWTSPLDYVRNIMAGRRLVLSRNAMGSVGAVSFRAVSL